MNLRSPQYRVLTWFALVWLVWLYGGLECSIMMFMFESLSWARWFLLAYFTIFLWVGFWYAVWGLMRFKKV